MRGAMWMALALLGTTPLVAVAQQQGAVGQQQQPAAGPTGAASIQQGQDTAGPGLFGPFGQQGNAGLNGVPLQNNTQAGGTGLQGTGGTGTVGPGGPTYWGTTPEMPSASPFLSPSTQTGTGAAGGTGGSGATGGSGGNAGATGGSGGQGTSLTDLQRRVEALEREVSNLRGTGGTGGAGGSGAGGSASAPRDTNNTANASRDDDAQPVTVVTVEFDGRVRDVTPQHIEVVDITDGTVSRLAIDDQTRAFKGSTRQQIPLKQISEGARVQTSFAYVDGVERARDIVVQSSPRKSQK
ncbi:PE-PGRS family protein [Cystobacter fuscus DSM 2262]|uniref:PE-PGRS family protein n=1 Tax=Cystobacter fuscus (strain ATCC 25194 / DSM 2262 / NBRC 100088 / M29) TaxID=1242864 RepID=S9P655_CYSF2|nr:hypothetical protein [Cystobacter fuscus]EPX59960.1 PE-PGRS family protein [Cystobacter fuscus DSM 2262]